MINAYYAQNRQDQERQNPDKERQDQDMPDKGRPNDPSKQNERNPQDKDKKW